MTRNSKYRILVGTADIAGMMPDFADGFRQSGHQVTTVIVNRNRLYPDVAYDVDMNATASHWRGRTTRWAPQAFRMVNRLHRLARLPRMSWGKCGSG